MKNKIKTIKNEVLNEELYQTVLENGMTVYLCKKEGFSRKIGMVGTKYGSLTNHFVDILTGNEVQVPDGVAHFLEHKLFEQEGENALDLFSKEGISANAYTSFNQTVYYFETIDKFTKGLEMLIKLVKTPYFTDANVAKEQGIIGQEISMYDDEPNYKVYFNTLTAMYQNNPIKIDIAGTIDSISHITKETLYTCYNTFYHPNNMFMVIVGDVPVEETIDTINENLKLYESKVERLEIVKFLAQEPSEIAMQRIEKTMGIYMPQVAIGYKLDLVTNNEIVKREVIADMIYEMYFSDSSAFYEKEYNLGVINNDIEFVYEGTKEFSHVILSTTSNDNVQFERDVIEYIEKLKQEEVDKELFDMIKRKKIGQTIILSENLNASYRRIIDSIINESAMYYDIEQLKAVTTEDIKAFLSLLKKDKQVISVVK